MFHENWPMIVALAVAVAIGWLVFTVLRPSSSAPTPAHAPAPMAAAGRS